MRRWVRLLVAGAMLACAGAAMSGTAQAHALLRSSQPANGATLAAAPSRVVCIFTEPPDPQLSILHVLDTGGHAVEKGRPFIVADERSSLAVLLPPSLPNGTYTVSWRTVSKVDGHVAGGSFAFGVGEAPSATGATPSAVSSAPSPGTLAAAGRWLFLVGLIVLFGGALCGLVVYRRQLPPRAGPMLGIATALTVAGLAAMVVAEHHTIAASWSALFRSTPGRYLIAQAVAVVVVVAAAAAAARWQRRALPLAALTVTSGGTVLVHVMSGHADTPGANRLGHLALQWLHVLAVGAWIGGLIWLLWFMAHSSRPERAGPVRRFSALATVALVLVAGSGVWRAWSEVGSVHQLWSTDFGRVLDIKMGLFLGLAALGAVNRFWLVPAMTRGDRRGDTLRWTVTSEVATALPIVLAASVLSQLSPASYASSTASRPEQIVVDGADYGTTTRAHLTVAPGTPGPNSFSLRLTDYDTGRPVAATSVQLRFSLPARPDVGASTLALTPTGDGEWRATGTSLSLSGSWRVIIVVQRRDGSVTVPLTVTTRAPEQRIDVQRAAGQPDLYTITLADGSVMQTYIDPGRAGQNAVHATFFKPTGDEETIATVRFTASSPTGARTNPKPFRFDKGHFDINMLLVAGNWSFEISGTTADRRVLDGHFSQDITPAGEG